MMGVFDWVIVEAGILPEGLPGWVYEDGLEFQTKSMECMMDTYVIWPDGTLVSSLNRGIPDDVVGYNRGVDYTGTIDFYVTNVIYVDRWVIGIREETGDLPVSVKLKATFNEGKLVGGVRYEIKKLNMNGAHRVMSGVALREHVKDSSGFRVAHPDILEDI